MIEDKYLWFVELRNKYERRTPTKGRPSLKATRKVSDIRKRRMADNISIGNEQSVHNRHG